MQTALTARQMIILDYIASCYRCPPKSRLASWAALYRAGLIQGPRFSCHLTAAGRAALESAYA
jgi:hypothetical protein